MDTASLIALVAVVALLIFGIRFGKAMGSLERRISDLEDNMPNG